MKMKCCSLPYLPPLTLQLEMQARWVVVESFGYYEKMALGGHCTPRATPGKSRL